jgi:NitT/TauT family transport system ATP-binding protein
MAPEAEAVDNEGVRVMTANGGIAIRNVSKTYRTATGDTVALDAFDLDIADGEFVAIVGPSGCGKSTIMRLIAGLTPVSTGAIEVFGRPVSGPVHDVGIVFQQPILLDWRDVLGNVLFQIDMRGLDVQAHRPKALDLLRQVGLADFTAKRPYELSGGMKQRAAIARALVHEPPLLMMDEPFGALDALTREQMRLDLEQLWMATKKTVLFITHSIDEAVLLADRVVVMSPRPGRIERVIEVAIPRPRGFEGRKQARFHAVSDEITGIFLARGVLQRG